MRPRGRGRGVVKIKRGNEREGGREGGFWELDSLVGLVSRVFDGGSLERKEGLVSVGLRYYTILSIFWISEGEFLNFTS